MIKMKIKFFLSENDNLNRLKLIVLEFFRINIPPSKMSRTTSFPSIFDFRTPSIKNQYGTE